MPTQILIIGAGITGLTTAYRLLQRQPDLHVTILEQNQHVGGNIHTLNADGFRVETGPNGFLDNKPTTLQLCRDLGLGDRLIAASEGSRKNRYVFIDQKLQRLPGSLMSFVRSRLLTLRGKWSFAMEPYRKPPSPLPDDESIAEFATRRAGRQAAEVFADALTTGIHGGDPALLSVRACFPRLVNFENEHGSVIRGVFRAAKKRRLDAEARGETPPGPTRMWSFREGLQTLVDTLREKLGDHIVTGASIERVERHEGRWRAGAYPNRYWDADHVILTCPAYEQAKLLHDLDEPLVVKLREIAYNAIAVVALGFRANEAGKQSLDGFGYIAPQRTKRDVLGVQWCSSIFPDRAPDGMVLWRALCGGWHRAEMVDWDDQRLIRAVVAELRLAQGVTGEPVFTRVVRWNRAIPQYFVGHLARIATIEQLASKYAGLHLSGNAFHGVAMNDCVDQGDVLAKRILGSSEPEA